MKNILWFLLCSLISSNYLVVQSNHIEIAKTNKFPTCAEIHLKAQCTDGIKLIPINVFSYVPAPKVYTSRKGLGKVALVNFGVRSWDNNVPDSARQAVLKAIDIWSHLISSSQSIKIDVHWDDTTSDHLWGASSEFTNQYKNGDLPGLNLPKDKIYYPIALAEMLSNSNLNQDSAEIDITINGTANLSYATDGSVVADKYDLVTIILHEIAHGLGFNGGGEFMEGNDTNPDMADFLGKPSIYDSYIYWNKTGDGKLVIDLDILELAEAFTSNNLYFNGPKAAFPKLYAPVTWKRLSSLYHLDEDFYPTGNENSLMTSGLHKGEIIHSPGPITLRILEDMGWINPGRIITISSPLTDATFTGGGSITVQWTDTKDSFINIKLLKKNESTNQYELTAIGGSANSSSSGMNTYNLTSIPDDDGRFKIQMEDYFNTGIIYGESGDFIIQSTILPPAGKITVETPTFSPSPNTPSTPFLSTQYVTLSCATDSATIYYTNDGKDVYTSSTRVNYTTPIAIDMDMMIQACAEKSGCIKSNKAVGRYYYGEHIPPPEVYPTSGTYVGGTKVTVMHDSDLVCYFNLCQGSGCNSPLPDPKDNPVNWDQYHKFYERLGIGLSIFKFQTYSQSKNQWSEVIQITYTGVYGLEIAQVDTQANSFGEWKRREGSIWRSFPAIKIAPPSSATTFQILADQNYKLGTNQKYYMWKKIGASTTNYIFNHADVPVGPGDDGKRINAQFLAAEQATIQSKLIDGGNPAGVIQFRDPWFIDSIDVCSTPTNRGTNAIFHERNSPLVLIDPDFGHKGVFLNQTIASGNYYSIRATQIQTNINGFTGFFQNWSATGVDGLQATSLESPVVFRQSNATVTALYKAHLGSSVSTATAGGGRKVISDCGGVTHIVYESAGSIWYTCYDGSTWSPEVLISNPGRVAKNPSITTSYDGSFGDGFYVDIVWEELDIVDDDGQWHEVLYRRKRQGAWEPIISLDWVTDIDAMPVVESFVSGLPVVAVWKSGIPGWVNIVAQANPSTNDDQIGISPTYSNIQGDVAMTDGHVNNNGVGFNIVYNTGTAMYYIGLPITGTNGIGGGESPMQLTWSSGCANPSIKAVMQGSGDLNKTAVVAWDSTNGSNRVVCYKERNASGVWQPKGVISHGSDQLSQPSVNFDLSSDKINILYQYATHIGRSVRDMSGGSWSSVIDLGTGTCPNAAASSPIAVFATGSAAPYAVNTVTLPAVVSGTISSNTTWNGVYTVTGTVTVNAGVTLTINPGSVISFASGTQLIVNGTLNAAGNSSQRITFDRNGASGTWGGIRFNSGSSGTVSYCDIKHATTGITCNAYLPSISNCTITGNGTGISVSSVASSNNKISYNTIQNNTSCGIYVTQSVIKCNNNTISSNGTYGINCTNPSNNYIGLNPYFHHNIITGNTYGLSCSYCSPNFIDNSSSPNRGYNVIRQNATGISVVYNSNVFLGAGPNAGGYNCLHDNNGYEITAAYSCFISAANTWWNKLAPYLPNPSVDFSLAYSSSVCYMPMSLTSDPNGCGLPQTSVTTVANNQTLLKTSSVNTTNAVVDAYFDDELIQLILLESEGKYEDAITSYKQIFGREKNTIKGRYALRKLKECCLQLKQENDFEDYLSKSVRTKVTGKDELYALLAEFDYQTLFEKQDYAGVLKNFTDILKTYKNNEEVYKHIVFDIGFLYLNALKDSSQANKYFSYLSIKYPVDPLAINAKYLLEKSAGADSLAKSVEDLENELGIKSEIPAGYELSNNYPNPFNPATTISYQIPNTGHVTLKVFDMLGREVAILADEMKEAGYYSATFDGTRLSSGVYFARFVVQPQEGNKPFVQVKKMLMMK